jgi:uncharacterized protein with GYD domain
MALYMTQFSYTSEAWAALASNPEDRSEAIRALVESMGGQLVSFYYSFGEYDGVAIYEAPDESAVATIMLAVSAAGHMKATRTTPLVTVEDTLDSLSKAGEMMYRGPGG